jgi:phospholipid transport system substrate-binding protein
MDTKVDGAYGSVKTEIVKKNNVRVPIEYRFVKTNDLWKVYDVVIEGVSLVNNYRPQFNGIINSKSYEDLVKMLKEKQKP